MEHLIEQGLKDNLPEFYMETYGQLDGQDVLLFRHEMTGLDTGWVKIHAPHSNNAQVYTIVFSEGLEIYNLYIRMDLPVEDQYIYK